ncbi:hypothetical protein [Chelativorans salis]|uniref:Uncharacterized protein n=1 Tax=Chelativorans salis TaxID=2978478 RepID=A0ABT2LN85_9HYPH|nr:hypothetical protein [Chelativorans sp. EGI FJ00035]MCT7376030.1 hypothetical protein [Chelativorans sp. EGI FJ00035]
MYRDFFKRLAFRKRHPPPDIPPDENDPDLSRKLTTLLIPGPPGVADHVLWSLLLKGTPGEHGRQGKRRRRGRG